MSVDIQDLQALCHDVFGTHAKRDQDSSDSRMFDAALWEVLTNLGLTSVGIAEAMGGTGGSLVEAAAIVTAASRHAARIPLAEASMLAGWLLSSNGIEIPNGVLTIGADQLDATRVQRGWWLRGRLRRVAFGRDADWISGLAKTASGPAVFVIDPHGLTITSGANLAGEPRDDISIDTVVPESAVVNVVASVHDELLYRAALARALMIAGAMETALSMSIDYAKTRKQFGRPIGNFQSVQNHVAQMAGEAATVSAITHAALNAYDSDGMTPRVRTLVAAAKVLTVAAGSTVAAIAHQIHGAIGMTYEFALHEYTSRIWSWCDEWGSQTMWAGELGSAAAATGGKKLWAWLEGSA